MTSETVPYRGVSKCHMSILLLPSTLLNNMTRCSHQYLLSHRLGKEGCLHSVLVVQTLKKTHTKQEKIRCKQSGELLPGGC